MRWRNTSYESILIIYRSITYNIEGLVFLMLRATGFQKQNLIINRMWLSYSFPMNEPNMTYKYFHSWSNFISHMTQRIFKNSLINFWLIRKRKMLQSHRFRRMWFLASSGDRISLQRNFETNEGTSDLCWYCLLT